MRNHRRLPLRDAWLIWFFLGVVMLNYPFLHIFNKEILLFGIPLPILYFFVGWPVSIIVIYLFSIYLGTGSERRTPPSDSRHNSSSRGEP